VPAIARVVAGDVVARLEGGDGASSMARKAASVAILAELSQVRAAYDVADALIDVAGAMLTQMIQQQRETMQALLGGQDPFEFFRDAGVNITHQLADRAAALEQAAVLSTSGKERADGLRAGCDSALNYVNSFNLPAIDFPGADLLLAPLQSAISEGKSMARGPIEALKSNADEVAEYLGVFADIAREQIAAARKHIEDISAGLAKCNSFEDVANLMLQKLQDVLGTGTSLNIQDIRNYWNGIGGQIDDAMRWAQQLGEDEPAEPPASAAGAAAPPATPAAAGAAAGASAGAGAAVQGKPMKAPASASAAGGGAAGAAAAGGAAGPAAAGAAGAASAGGAASSAAAGAAGAASAGGAATSAAAGAAGAASAGGAATSAAAGAAGAEAAGGAAGPAAAGAAGAAGAEAAGGAASSAAAGAAGAAAAGGAAGAAADGAAAGAAAPEATIEAMLANAVRERRPAGVAS
jgi:hypothetical protein